MFPYTAAPPEQSGYVDFTEHPERIETSLEDFRPFAHVNAIQVFYNFLRWMNGAESLLLTADCAFRSPREHQDDNSHLKLCAHGRVFVLFRHLPFNSSPQHADWLCGKMMHELTTEDSNLLASQGVVAATKQPALQTAISEGVWHGEDQFEVPPNDPGFGHHLMLTFWAYGDSETEAFENLERVFLNIWSASRQIVTDMRANCA